MTLLRELTIRRINDQKVFIDALEIAKNELEIAHLKALMHINNRIINAMGVLRTTMNEFIEMEKKQDTELKVGAKDK